jgi:hypothetical protein
MRICGSLQQVSTKYVEGLTGHVSLCKPGFTVDPRMCLKIGITRQLLVKVSHTKFDENLSNGLGADTRSQTDGQI